MIRALVFLAVLFSAPHASNADIYSDFYFASKRSIDPELFQRAENIKGSFGSPFVFPEKLIRAYDVVGISGVYGKDVYDDDSIEPWALELTDLAIQVNHIRTLLRSKGITTSVWREQLIAYEDVQLDRIRNGLPPDQLKNLRGSGDSFQSVYEAIYYKEELRCGDRFGREIYWSYWSVEYHTCDPLGLAKLNQQILDEIIETNTLSEAESILASIIKNSFDYIFERNDQRLAFLVWEPACECGNGSFSIKIELPTPNQSINIASEFSYRVCEVRLSKKITRLSECLGTHTLGSGQSVYLSGDYRYQITGPEDNVGRLNSIQLRGADIDGRTLRFLAAGHEIVE